MCNIDLQNTKDGERMATESITISLSQFNQMCKEIEELRAYKKQQEEKADVLDEIRREIEEDIEQVEETVDYDCNGYGKTGVNYLVYLVDVLEVIDKYRKARDKE